MERNVQTLLNLGFTNRRQIREALVKCKHMVDAALQYLIENDSPRRKDAPISVNRVS